MPSELQAILCALHDSLMLLAPRGWLQAELEIAPSEHGPRLASISARGGGGAQPLPHPKLNVDSKQEALRFSDGLVDLASMLEAQGKPWSGGKIAVVRDEEHADWKLLRPDGALAWLGRLDRGALESLLYTDALFAMLQGSEKAFAMLQAELAQALGEQVGWREAGDALEIDTAAGAQRFQVEPIGRYTLSELSFTWAWADDALARRSGRIHDICGAGSKQPGLSVLWRSHLHCDEGFIWALAGHCAVALGARGLFRAEQNGSIGLYGLMKRL